MTTSVAVRGDVAAPVTAVNTLPTIGRVAMNVYKFATPADVIAAGFNIEAGPATPVYEVSQAELDSGAFIAEGDPYASPVYVTPAGMLTVGSYAIPVVVVNP